MKGKVFVIEAGDASGKATQTEKLCQRLIDEGCRVRKVEFPDYNSDSSALVKMYLNGEFGDKPDDVNPFVASTFYTVDRYASYSKIWKEFYLDGGIIICDRYATSNMIHQASKIQNEGEKEEYLKWLWDMEFEKFKLPVPDCVVFLDMPPEYSQQLMKNRANKYTGDANKDIHEKNYDYLVKSYNNSCFIADKYKWNRISCVKDESIKSIDSIHEEIYQVVKSFL